MAKRKRNEQVEAPAVNENGKGKKQKVQTPAVPEKKEQLVTNSKQKAAVAPAQVPEVSKPTALRIIIGSYEKVLAGIDARFTSEAPGNVVRFLSFLTYRIKCC